MQITLPLMKQVSHKKIQTRKKIVSPKMHIPNMFGKKSESMKFKPSFGNNHPSFHSLVTIWTTLGHHLETTRSETTLRQLWDNFATTWRQLWNYLETKLELLGDNFGTTLGLLGDIFETAWRKLWDHMVTTWRLLAEHIYAPWAGCSHF